MRKSKILFMDEATSSIGQCLHLDIGIPCADNGADFFSDRMIQDALRKQLDEGVTVLTVAHRLSTIKDYDRIVSS